MTLSSRRSEAAKSGPSSSRLARVPMGTVVAAAPGTPGAAAGLASAPPASTSTAPSASSRTRLSPNASRVRVTSACNASSPRSTLPATVASSSDSAAARRAVRVRRAAWSTT
nr:hypothetical protein BJQ95_00367 [Cryobacterium sp. SO1]